MPSNPREGALLDVLAGSAGGARIAALARRFGVSEETVRRDVRKLEAQGLVSKVHGGAHLNEKRAEPSYARRLVKNPEAKRRIGRAVAGMIADGASLFLDVGSTTAYVAQALHAHRELLVVTNSLAVAQALAGRNGNRVFMAGGELRPHDGGAFGAEALAFVRQFRVSMAILSVAAIDPASGFLLQDIREAEFSRAIIERSDLAVVAADGSKFGLRAPIRIAEPEAFHRLVSDMAPPDAVAALLKSAGISFVPA